MMTKSLSRSILVFALVCSALAASRASAQCCGVATTAYYQPAAYTAYSPVAYTTYRTGWYPGYFFDRIRTRLWGAPSTYVASYPTTYAASYPSSYVASYPTSYGASYPAYTSTSYAPTYSSTVSCPTCVPTQQETMRPIACCDPCASGSYSVSQTSYEQPGCDCGVAPYNGGSSSANGIGQPQLPPTYDMQERRRESDGQPTESEARDDADTNEPERATGTGEETDGVQSGSGAQLQAPELFNPNGRMARRSVAPVRNALYTQPVSQRQISTKPLSITAEQALHDAAGWRSAAK